jgi:hypothetical protein
MDSHSYKGWLNSDSFLKRSFGVFFYYCFASIIFSVIFFAIFFIIILFTGLLGTYLETINSIEKSTKTDNSWPNRMEKNFDDQKYR